MAVGSNVYCGNIFVSDFCPRRCVYNKILDPIAEEGTGAT